jgi:hypothetical protein
MYAESKGESQKKKIFFEKMKGILNSKELEQTDNIIIRGDANSEWNKKDTSNLEENIDRSIRVFYEEMRLIDIMREKRKRIMILKEEKERVEYLRSIYTWELDSLNLSKRHNSFWSLESIMISINHVKMVQDNWIASDHHLIIADLEIDMNLERVRVEEEQTTVVVDNKRKGKTLKKDDWKEYRRKVKQKIDENKEMTQKLNKIEIPKIPKKDKSGKKRVVVKDIMWVETLVKLSEKLKIKSYENKSKIERAREEVRRISMA